MHGDIPTNSHMYKFLQFQKLMQLPTEMNITGETTRLIPLRVPATVFRAIKRHLCYSEPGVSG